MTAALWTRFQRQEAAKILSLARECEPMDIWTMQRTAIDAGSKGAFERIPDHQERVVAIAMNIVVNHGQWDAAWDTTEGICHRIGPFLLETDSDGFHRISVFPEDEEAEREGERRHAAHLAILEQHETYEVTRMYQSDDWPSEVVATGLSLAEAQERCQDPETSSSTCTTEEGRLRTVSRGAWFEGYEREES